MKLCLNMIVKNESARIERALKTAVQFIDCYAIVDTGSTDDTIDKIKKFFAAHAIPGVIDHAPFNDWSQARNAALTSARLVQPRFGWEWCLLMDADMELVVKSLPDFEGALDHYLKNGAHSLDMEQRAGTCHYANRRLVSKYAKGMYVGVTHEYLDVDAAGMIDPSIAYFDDRADGSNRSNKTERDINLLLGGLKAEPNNGRYYYYLARSYKEQGNIEEAKNWFKKRVDFGGWEEERWSAQVEYAHCLKAQDNEQGFVMEMLKAYKMRPQRAEALYDLAHYFRHKDGWQSVAAMFAEVGMSQPRTADLLFVNDYVYEVGLKEEFAITGYYNEAKRGKAFQACSELTLQPGPYANARASARFNLYWYLQPLGTYCPSFQSRQINWTPPADWIAMNPSVTVHGNDLWCVVRTVNYRIDEHGRYLIRGTDGTANDSNPINTRNYLLDFGKEPFDIPKSVREIVAPPNLPCEFKPVIGFEDMRLFSFEDDMWTSSTVRQIHWDGNCEQVLARIDVGYGGGWYEIREYHRMLREPRETEKNWAPIVGLPTKLWMWRPGTTINASGKFVHDTRPKITTDIVSGGSQVIKVGPFWIALVHTAHQIPGSSCRYYYHRFAVYNDKFELMTLSRPFVFHDRVIEFAAGLAVHPTQPDTLVISYGLKDAEARIATVKIAEVMGMIWAPYR